ncbi:hypothetical protein C8R48DRAFT_697799, partial [Suillus tomentosus]
VHCFALFVVSFVSFLRRTLDRYISSSLPDIGLGNLLLKLSSYSLEVLLRNLPSSTRNCMSKAYPPNAFEITFATRRSTLHRGLQQDGARQLQPNTTTNSPPEPAQTRCLMDTNPSLGRADIS